MTDTVYSVLWRTRERLRDPAAWAKGYGHGLQGPSCVGLTMARYIPAEGRYLQTLGEACRALLEAAGIEPCGGTPDMLDQVYDWNDDPATTHADVLKALDKGLAACS